MSLKRIALYTALAATVGAAAEITTSNRPALSVENDSDRAERESADEIYVTRNWVSSKTTEMADGIDKLLSEEARYFAEIENKIADGTTTIDELISSNDVVVRNYLRFCRQNYLGIEPIFIRGILISSGANNFRDYMNVVSDYSAKRAQIIQILNDEIVNAPPVSPNSNKAREREFDYNNRNNQLELINRLIQGLEENRIGKLNDPEEVLRAIDQIAEEVNQEMQTNAVRFRFSTMTRSAANPNLARAIMINETFPAIPGGSPEVTDEIARLLMQSGYNPNYKLSARNIHLTIGYFHVSGRTAYRYIMQTRNASNLRIFDLEGVDESNPLSVADTMERALADPIETSRLYMGLTFHNLNTFENWILNMPELELKQNLIAFINNPENHEAFIAISTLFHKEGTGATWRAFVINKLTESNFDAELFVENMKRSHEYVREVLRMYEYYESIN